MDISKGASRAVITKALKHKHQAQYLEVASSLCLSSAWEFLSRAQQVSQPGASTWQLSALRTLIFYSKRPNTEDPLSAALTSMTPLQAKTLCNRNELLMKPSC